MWHRVPHSRRFWRLVQDLREDGLVSESEEETDWDSDSEEEFDESESCSLWSPGWRQRDPQGGGRGML